MNSEYDANRSLTDSDTVEIELSESEISDMIRAAIVNKGEQYAV